MRCREAAERLAAAAPPHREPPPYSEGRFLLGAAPGEREIWAVDSVGKVVPADTGRVLLIGSHAALHGGRPESALAVDARAAIFHDAGVGAAGVTRLGALAARRIAAVAVDGMTARIGDGRSLWETGVIAHVNDAAAALGARAGMRAQAFARRCASG
jgi:carbonic anhydrase/acetyltransferase-like protein (isoleucine patch superfamily)